MLTGLRSLRASRSGAVNRTTKGVRNPKPEESARGAEPREENDQYRPKEELGVVGSLRWEEVQHQHQGEHHHQTENDSEYPPNTAARAQIAFDSLEIVHSQTLRLGQRGRQCSRLVIEVGSASCGDSGQESISHQAGTQIVESLDEKDVLAKD